MKSDNTNKKLPEENGLNSRLQLIEVLENLHAIETHARNNYETDIATFKNFIIQDTIERIKKDEDKHIALLADIIKMLKNRIKEDSISNN